MNAWMHGYLILLRESVPCDSEGRRRGRRRKWSQQPIN